MRTSDLNDPMQVWKENKLSVCKLPAPCLWGASWLGTQAHSCHFHSILRKLPLWFTVQSSHLIWCAKFGGLKGPNFASPFLLVHTGETPWPTAFLITVPGVAQQTHKQQVSVPTSYKVLQTSLWHPPVETRNTSLSCYCKACPLQQLSHPISSQHNWM